MASSFRFVFALVPVGLLASVVASQGCSSPPEQATVDGGVDGANDSSGNTPTDDSSGDTLCNQPAISDAKCSPTQACPAPYECFYRPGCDAPEGVCALWEVCELPDTLALVVVCECDGGGTVEAGHTPFAHFGYCGDAAPAD